jgi:hypothetical protein
MTKSKVKAITARYKKIGKDVVVETGGHDSKGHKVYRIVGKIWGK